MSGLKEAISAKLSPYLEPVANAISRMIEVTVSFIFTKIFGELDISAGIYVDNDEFLIVDLRVITRFGTFGFDMLKHKLPGNSHEFHAPLHKITD